MWLREYQPYGPSRSSRDGNNTETSPPTYQRWLARNIDEAIKRRCRRPAALTHTCCGENRSPLVPCGNVPSAFPVLSLESALSQASDPAIRRMLNSPTNRDEERSSPFRTELEGYSVDVVLIIIGHGPPAPPIVLHGAIFPPMAADTVRFSEPPFPRRSSTPACPSWQCGSFRPVSGRSVDRRGIPKSAVPPTRSSPVFPCPTDRSGKEPSGTGSGKTSQPGGIGKPILPRLSR